MFRQEQQFNQASSPIDLITISASPSEVVSYDLDGIHNRNMRAALDHTTPPGKGEDVEASLQVVRILREDNETLNISRGLFMEIFQLFEIEAYILYLISRNSYGFHRFESS